jgi:nitrogen fixation NifU-like protein
MATGLEQLYQQVILDHAKEQHGRGLREAPGLPSGENHQFNPLCGDEVTVRVALDSGVVKDLSWAGEGCSISRASTSVLHDLVVGRPLDEAVTLVAGFRSMIRSRGAVEPADELGDAAAFAGVGRHANRVKCAMLGWTAFEGALQDAGTSVEEQG